MSLVQAAHRRHQRDVLAVLAPAADDLAQRFYIANGFQACSG
jgi:hypothetical protein